MTSPKARPTLPSATGCETGRSRGAGEKRKRDGRRVARGVREIFARSGWAGEARSATRGGGDATGHRRGSAETESRVKRTAVASTRRGTRRSVAIAAVSLIRAGTRLGGCRRASPRRPPGDPTPRERGKSRGDAPSRLSRDFARTLPVGRAARAHVPVARRRLARPRRSLRRVLRSRIAVARRAARFGVPVRIFLEPGCLWCASLHPISFGSFFHDYIYILEYVLRYRERARRCFDWETSLGFFVGFLHNSVTN